MPTFVRNGMTYAWGLQVLADDGSVVDHADTILTVGGGRAVDLVAISPTGDRIAMRIDRYSAGGSGTVVGCLDVSTGALELALDNDWSEHGKVCGLAFLSEDDLLVLAEKSLRYVRRQTDGSWDIVGATKLSKSWGMTVRPLEGVPVAAIVTTSSKPLCVVAAPPSGKLKKLGELRDPVQSVAWDGDELVAFDRQGRWWTVAGVREGAGSAR